MPAVRTFDIDIPLSGAEGQHASTAAPIALALGVWSNFCGLQATLDGHTAVLRFDAPDAAPGAVQVEVHATERTAQEVHALADGGTLRAWIDGGTLRIRIEPGWDGPGAPPAFPLPATADDLPPALFSAARAHTDAGCPLLAAGILARHALHRARHPADDPGDPLLDRALAWWDGVSAEPAQVHSQARFAEELAFALLEDLEAALAEGARLADEDLERLAVRRDDLCSACSLLRLVGVGAEARAVQHRVDEALHRLFVLHTGVTFTSPLLAEVAAHRGGWWAVAPGAAHPPAPAAWDAALDDDLAWAEELDAVFASEEPA